MVVPGPCWKAARLWARNSTCSYKMSPQQVLFSTPAGGMLTQVQGKKRASPLLRFYWQSPTNAYLTECIWKPVGKRVWGMSLQGLRLPQIHSRTKQSGNGSWEQLGKRSILDGRNVANILPPCSNDIQDKSLCLSIPARSPADKMSLLCHSQRHGPDSHTSVSALVHKMKSVCFPQCI